VPGTEAAKTVEPDSDYRLPFGKARVVQPLGDNVGESSTLAVITYGRGVHWALEASKAWPGRVEILDLRSLSPIDESAMLESVGRCHRCLVLTEEPPLGSFAQALAGLISDRAFEQLDAPVRTLGSMEVPAIPLNETLEAAVLPNAEKVAQACQELLDY